MPFSSWPAADSAHPVCVNPSGDCVLVRTWIPDTSEFPIEVRELSTGALKQIIPNVDGRCDDIRLSPDNSLVMGIDVRRGENGSDREFTIWQSHDGKAVYRDVVGGYYSRNGGLYHVLSNGKKVLYSKDAGRECHIEILGIASREILKTINAVGVLFGVAPDEQTIAIIAKTQPTDFQIHIYDVSTGNCTMRLDAANGNGDAENLASQDVKSVAFSKDGKQVGMIAYTAPSDAPGEGHWSPAIFRPKNCRVCVWDVATGHLKKDQLWPFCEVAIGYRGYWESHFLHVGRRSRTSWNSYQVQLLRPGDNQTLCSFEQNCDRRFQCGNDAIRVFADGIYPSPQGRLVAISDRNENYFPDWVQRLLLKVGLTIAQSRIDEPVGLKIYDVDTQNVIQQMPSESFAGYSNDGQFIATKNAETHAISIWSMPPNKPWLTIVMVGACFVAAMEVVFQIFAGICRRLLFGQPRVDRYLASTVHS